MMIWSWKAVGVVLAVLLLLAIGAGGGAWLTSLYYRPQLDDALAKLATEQAVNGSLLALTTEQGRALGKLVAAGKAREDAARVAAEAARQQSTTDYAAANRIQQERTGGDPATAAMSIIDQELGL